MQKMIIVVSVLIIFTLPSINSASAVCCFPWDITYHIDPKTGFLVMNGELWNDSYKQEPFGNTDYRFEFIDGQDNVLFEKSIIPTNLFPINGGARIPFNTVFPFQVVIDDIDKDILQNVNHIRFDGTNSLDYFSWKPADLEVTFDNIKKIKIVGSKNNEEFFNQWQINGIIKNKYLEKTKNVFVVASLHDEDDRLIGVAGYSDEDIQPLTLDGNQTKEFSLFSLVPADRIPVQVNLYSESEDSSMIHKFYMPIILKDTTDHEDRISRDYKKPITLSANVTNTSRELSNLDWIIQIKKSPRGLSDGDVTKYPDSKIEEIKYISSKVEGQKSIKLEYSWMPQSDGVYFYEYFVWDGSQPLSFPFKGTFLQDSWLMVDSSNDSLKNQLKSGTPFDSLECRFDLVLIQKIKTGNFICVKPETKEELMKRGWEEPIGYSMSKSAAESESELVYSHPFGLSEENYRNLEPIYRESPNNPAELILDIDAMIKQYELDPITPEIWNGTWSVGNWTKED